MSEEIMGYVMADPTKYKVGETYTTCSEKGLKPDTIYTVKSGQFVELRDQQNGEH